MARENYSYKKFQKELANKKKREEKIQSKLAKKNLHAQADAAQVQNPEVPGAETPAA